MIATAAVLVAAAAAALPMDGVVGGGWTCPDPISMMMKVTENQAIGPAARPSVRISTPIRGWKSRNLNTFTQVSSALAALMSLCT